MSLLKSGLPQFHPGPVNPGLQGWSLGNGIFQKFSRQSFWQHSQKWWLAHVNRHKYDGEICQTHGEGTTREIRVRRGMLSRRGKERYCWLPFLCYETCICLSWLKEVLLLKKYFVLLNRYCLVFNFNTCLSPTLFRSVATSYLLCMCVGELQWGRII